jgi:HD-GYP domain-containing protein (c-di-GMP phosphodiesterase class II)
VVETKPTASEATDLRLAELIASLSLACDLANAFPIEKALRNCLLAVEIAREMGIEGQDLSDAYYVGMLRSIGCTSFAHEESLLVGDDVAFRNTFAGVDFSRPPEVIGRAVGRLGKGRGPLGRARAVGNFMRQGQKFGAAMAAANCEAGARLAQRLGMSPGVARGLNEIYERWDGKGVPNGIGGEAVSLNALIGNFAHVVTVHHQSEALDTTLEIVARRKGGEFAPDVVDAFIRRAPELLSVIEAESVWDAALETEPEPRPWLPESRLPEIALAFAHFADLKSPFMLGHSSGVADLARRAGEIMGLADVDVGALRISGLLHDLGRVSVPNAIWEKKGPLSVSEWERVRLHAYYTERVLSQSALLPFGRLGGMHHERLDGSGYHRSVPAALLPVPARILAAADAYHAMSEERPHRKAMVPGDAEAELHQEVAAGRLDREAVAAVLEAGGHPAMRPARREWPGGLTDREVEVLRLVARGLSNKQVAAELFISDATVHHHVLHVYQKIGLSTRAGAALFAMENDLLPERGMTGS